MPNDAALFIDELLELDPARRLGCTAAAAKAGADSIRSHAYLRDVDWDMLVRKLVPPPWRPSAKELDALTRFEPAEQSHGDADEATLLAADGCETEAGDVCDSDIPISEDDLNGKNSPFKGF